MPQIPENSPTPEAKIETELLEGTVMKSSGGVYEVDVAPHEKLAETIVCALGGRLKKGKRSFAQPVSVGDRVCVRHVETSGASARGLTNREGFIESVLPRKSQLGRSRFNKTAQITLANLDQVVIVMASREPDLNTHRLDRFLVLAEANELRVVIVFNKIDLLKKSELRSEIEPLEKLYSGLGYPTLLTSAELGIDIGREALKNELKDHISAFIGSSGVGKSSLVMMIQPALQLWIGEVMEMGKGRHTTTDVTLHRLDGGGYIADTPGVKTIAMLEQHEIVVESCFPEFRAVLGTCKFNDCTHIHEPGCAVRAALEKGEIAATRYESYARLWGEIDAMAPVYSKKKEGGRSSIFSDEI